MFDPLTVVFTHVVNFYLAPDEPDKKKTDEWKQWQKKDELHQTVAKVASVGSDPVGIATLEGYVREALRTLIRHNSICLVTRLINMFLGLDPVVEGVYRVATNTIPVGPLQAERGTRFYFDFGKAGKDGRTFDKPEEVISDRDPRAYRLYHGDGVFKTLGEDFVTRAAAEVLRAVFSKTKIKRTVGNAGTLRR